MGDIYFLNVILFSKYFVLITRLFSENSPSNVTLFYIIYFFHEWENRDKGYPQLCLNTTIHHLAPAALHRGHAHACCTRGRRKPGSFSYALALQCRILTSE